MSKNEKQNNILRFFYSDSGFTARQDYFTHFDPSRTWGGAKTGDPREKPPDHQQAELSLSHMWPELGLNPQRWDDALKISVLNHSATGAAYFDIRYFIFGLCSELDSRPQPESRKKKNKLTSPCLDRFTLATFLDMSKYVFEDSKYVFEDSKYVFEDLMLASNTVN